MGEIKSKYGTWTRQSQTPLTLDYCVESAERVCILHLWGSYNYLIGKCDAIRVFGSNVD